MASINHVVQIGRLTRDPELRHTPGGDAVCQMRIAVDRAGDKQDDGSYAAGFFDVTCFKTTAENCAQYLSKGSQAAFVGALRYSEWEAKDGSGKRNKVEIIAFQVMFLGSPAAREDGQTSFTPAAMSAPSTATQGTDDDIPF